MPKYTYGGDQTVVFSHYLDVTDDPPKTLTAVPGETYDIKQAEGHTQIQPNGQFTDVELPMPPSDDWTEAKTEAKAKAEKKENG